MGERGIQTDVMVLEGSVLSNRVSSSHKWLFVRIR